MKPLFKTKRMLTATLLALVMMVAVGATLALMASTSNSVTNTFAAAQVETEIEEDGLDMGNKEVTIVNNGKSPVYVRARIMVSGVAESQVAIVGSETEATDQNKVYLVMENQSQWQQADASAKDNYYYYLNVLEPNQRTSELLTKVVIPGKDLRTKLKEMGEKFSVTVYHESVLAIGDEPEEPITADYVENAFETADGNTTSSTTP